MNFILIGRTILFVGDCYLDHSVSHPLSEMSRLSTSPNKLSGTIKYENKIASDHTSTSKYKERNADSSVNGQQCSDRKGTLRRTLYALSDIGIRKLFS